MAGKIHIEENGIYQIVFDPSSDKKVLKLAYKFYDSFIYVTACGYDKPNKYIYILEYPKGDSTTRKFIRNKIAAKLHSGTLPRDRLPASPKRFTRSC